MLGAINIGRSKKTGRFHKLFFLRIRYAQVPHPMGKVSGFIIAFIGVLLLGKAIAPMHAKLLLDAGADRKEQAHIQQDAARAPSLQDIIHEMVQEGKKGLPRKKADGLWLVSVDEAQNQMINTFEFVGIPANVITPLDVFEINQEVTTRFRTTFCRNEQLLQLLQRGMTYAQIHKLSETNQEISTVVLSIRDCDSQAIAPTSYSATSAQSGQHTKSTPGKRRDVQFRPVDTKPQLSDSERESCLSLLPPEQQVKCFQ